MVFIKKLLISSLLLVAFILPTQVSAAIPGTDIELSGDKQLEHDLKTPTLNVNIPGLDFSSVKDIVANKKTGSLPGGRTGEFLVIPFLGQYISAIYKFAVIAAGIISTIVIIVSGIQWTASGGNSSVVSSAKSRILNAVIGLGLAVGSYTILFIINPNLVSFDNLKVFQVETENIPEITIDSAGASVPTDGTVTKPPANPDELTSAHFSSKEAFAIWQSFTDAQKKEVMKYMYINTAECAAESEYTKTGINHCNLKNFKIRSSVVPALTKASQLAEKYGYQICIYSAYRPVKRQTQLWNAGIVKRYNSQTAGWQKNQGLIARPSCKAPHNTGGALDMYMKRDGVKKAVVSGTNNAYKTPNVATYKKVYFTENPPYKLIFEEIMKQAGFVRFCKEYWHFENNVTVRYSKWDKAEDTRCNFAYQNWKVPIPQDVKDKANNAVKNGPLFK